MTFFETIYDPLMLKIVKYFVLWCWLSVLAILVFRYIVDRKKRDG